MAMERYLYEVIMLPNELGGYDVHVPDLDIVTQGDDLADAAYMAQDAISLCISSKLRWPAPDIWSNPIASRLSYAQATFA